MVQGDKIKVLIVEDERDIQELLAYNFKREGFTVLTSDDGNEAISMINIELPNLVILDLMLPGVDGLTVCRTIKGNQRTSHIPVIMLTAKTEETDVVIGLELGADDYVPKPFSPRVLMARVRAVLRRKKAGAAINEKSVIDVHGLTLIPERYEARIEQEVLKLTATEFGILHFLARHPGWVYTRTQIVDAVRGADYPITDRTVDVHLVSLRKKLGKLSDIIETVRGIGYRFKDY